MQKHAQLCHWLYLSIYYEYIPVMGLLLIDIFIADFQF